ncbi:2-oxoacid dehydrogenases acyltransferase-domain-containing protein [Pisolithus thermaeus]|nr:2-oxoacid dehydrogenases acyltransferase-domain-containing protein [Pisolithus thermaeus]
MSPTLQAASTAQPDAAAASASAYNSTNNPLAQHSAASPSASLYVWSLDPSVTEATLLEVFNIIGPVASVHVCRDATSRRSLGYAYVNYLNATDAQSALEKLNHFHIKDRPCRITWSQPDPNLRKTGQGNLYVKNLDEQVDKKVLYDAFTAFGNVLSCKVVTNDQGQSKGYGFVQYESAEVAEKAIKASNGMLLKGKKVYVSHHISRKERQSKLGEETKAETTNVNVENSDSSVTKEVEEQFDNSLDGITNASVGSPIATVAEEGDNMFVAIQMASEPTAEEEPESSLLTSETSTQFSAKLTAKEEPKTSYPSASEATAPSSFKPTAKEEPGSFPSTSEAATQSSTKPTAKEGPNPCSLSTSEVPKDSVLQLRPREAKSELAKGGHILPPPIAKKFAPEWGTSPSKVQSIGLEGRSIHEDVDKCQPPVSTAMPVKATTEYTDIPIPNIHKVTSAADLTQSKQELPQHYLTMEIDMDEVLKLREVLIKLLEEKDKAVELTVNDFILKAVACALADVPEANSAWLGDVIRQYNKADISMAIATPTGLVAPIIKDVGSKGLAAISREAKALVKKVRDDRLIPQELQGATFTVSNLGMFGIDHFTAIINPPQSCNLGVGRMKPSIVPCLEEERGFKIVNIMKVTLSSDHRVVDSAVGARWMAAFKGYLENPLTLML